MIFLIAGVIPRVPSFSGPSVSVVSRWWYLSDRTQASSSPSLPFHTSTSLLSKDQLSLKVHFVVEEERAEV
jgi:hypothetical protein